MNLLKTFESRVSDAFGAAPQGYAAPISFKKLAKRAAREMEAETYEIDGVDTAPALITILVASADDATMRPLYGQLTSEVVSFVEAKAQEKRYVFVGKPLARFMVDPSLKSGKFAVFAENVDARTLERLRVEENAFLSGSAGVGGAAAGVGQTRRPRQQGEPVMQPLPQQEPQAAPAPARHSAEHQAAAPAANQPQASAAAGATVEGEFAPLVEPVELDASAGLGVIPTSVVDDVLSQDEADFGAYPQPAPRYQAPTGYEDSIMMAPTPEPTPAPVSTHGAGQREVPVTQRRNVPLVNPQRSATAPAEADAPTCLLIDHQTGRTYTGVAPTTIIGRERTPHGIVLRDPNVSRHHAELAFDGRNWSITDLNSTNGTMVNDRDVDSYMLRNGDLITVGLMNLEFREN
ncbi:FhaA domain-containing protein [Parafannyhessea umbonata]|uniref:FHA domain-containing protein n=1 Tax=Parafannyhessea umbonata TaxID=604330 RepID=A0A1H9Q637_9ACTN|nr:DUF3662 and FHA domain-containing protein [Parafannyhessea umbonata]SER55585.1 FHA domain-containing protein [Parafannyhessea umbonata]